MNEKKTPNEKFFGRSISRKNAFQELGDPSTWDADEARLLAQYYGAPKPLNAHKLALDAAIRTTGKPSKFATLAQKRVTPPLFHGAIAASGKATSAAKPPVKRPTKSATTSKKKAPPVPKTKPLVKVSATLMVAQKRKQNTTAPKATRAEKTRRNRSSTGVRRK